MRFASLGSGSKGNSTLVVADDTILMIDCGFSLRETRKRLARLAVEPKQIDAILVTHEHSDHCTGVAALSREYAIPVFLSHGTVGSGRCDGSYALQAFNSEESFTIGGIRVQSVPVPHDAAEPCQFVLRWQNQQLGILTDLGYVTPHVIDSFTDCDSLLLEFNHDVSMLDSGPYPEALKRRVGGHWGHLNNHQAAQLLNALGGTPAGHLVIAHISENNNTKALAEQALSEVPGALDKVVWAEQQLGFDWLNVVQPESPRLQTEINADS
ncbi:MAG: MBL fold metallo-hydrolase [Pseudomonadota bacterium]